MVVLKSVRSLHLSKTKYFPMNGQSISENGRTDSRTTLARFLLDSTNLALASCQ